MNTCDKPSKRKLSMIKLKNKYFDIPSYIENVYCLDNFSAFSVVVDNIEYKTAEHAFQSIKFLETNPLIAKQIMSAPSPFEARELAHKYKSQRRADWSSKKYEVMEKVLYLKTIQNSYVKQKLLETNTDEIIEDCGEDNDKDWGCGIDGTGQNNLGKIWMKIRDNINTSNI